jgi:multidrug efflux system outer membrane protein
MMPDRFFFIASRRRQWSVPVLSSLVLALSACSVPTHRDADPGPIVPKEFPKAPGSASAAPSSALTSIEDFFHDPVLTGLIAEALKNNLELKILAERIEIAGSKVLAKSGALMPTVEAVGGASLAKPSTVTPEGAVEEQLEIAPGVPFADPLPGFLVAAEFSWELDIWGRLRDAKEAARLEFLGSREGRNYVITRLVAEIAETYYTLLSLDTRLEVIDQAIVLQRQSLDIARSKKQAARETELAVQRFEAEVSRNESERMIVMQEIVQAENRLCTLAGRFPGTIERNSKGFLSLDNDALNTGVPSELLRNRPDIRRAELEIQAAGLEINVARTAFYPSLTLTGGAAFDANSADFMFQTPESVAANIAGGLVAPLLNTKELEAEYQATNAKQLMAMYEYQQTVLNAFTEVVTRLSMVSNYGKSIDFKAQQLLSLEGSVASAMRLFQNARAEYSEVLFAQRDLIEAKLILIETKREQLSAIVNAYQALGGGNVLATPVASTEAVAPVP